jgi:biotin carboxyl carrier protein
MTAKVLVNGKAVVLTLRRNGKAWIVDRDGESFKADVVETGPGAYHVLLEGRSYEVRVAGPQMDINGQEITALLEDPRDAETGSTAATVQGRQPIMAPMPGKVVRVLVSEGDPVEGDQGIVVIEAMKMQNELRSPKAGRVASISTRQGATVASGDVLAVIE